MLTDGALIAILTASRSPCDKPGEAVLLSFTGGDAGERAGQVGTVVLWIVGVAVVLGIVFFVGWGIMDSLGNHKGFTGTVFCLSILGMTAAYIIASEALGAISFGAFVLTGIALINGGSNDWGDSAG